MTPEFALDPPTADDHPRDAVVLGWATALLVFACAAVVDLSDPVNAPSLCAAANGGAMSTPDALALGLAGHLLVPLLVLASTAAAARWVAFAVAAGTAAATIAQEIHLRLLVDADLGALGVPDFVHHALMLWLVAVSWRWAREAAQAGNGAPGRCGSS